MDRWHESTGCHELNPHTPSQRHRCACGQVCQITSSSRLNFSFTHTFNPLPFTSRFLFCRPLRPTAGNSPPAAAKRAPTRTNAHTCQELSISDANLSRVNNSSLLQMQWCFAGILMVDLKWGYDKNMPEKKKSNVTLGFDGELRNRQL